MPQLVGLTEVAGQVLAAGPELTVGSLALAEGSQLGGTALVVGLGLVSTGIVPIPGLGSKSTQEGFGLPVGIPSWAAAVGLISSKTLMDPQVFHGQHSWPGPVVYQSGGDLA